MQSRRREHGSSSGGELDVFGATSYFAALPPPDGVTTFPSISADQVYLQPNNKVQRDTTRMTAEDSSFRSPQHHQQQQLARLQVVAKRHQSSGKSKLAALLSFMVSPSPSLSPRASSFRKEKKKKEQEAAAPPTSRLRQASAAGAADGDEREPANNTCYNCKVTAAAASSSSSRESSMHLQGLFLGAHVDDELDDDDELVDLGVATGDRRLQGITVVRGGGGADAAAERWVVRCVMPGAGAGGAACWDDEEEHRETKMLIDGESASSEQQNFKDELKLVEVGQEDHDADDGTNIIDPAHSHSWDSDSSSDLFDLDLECR